MDASCTLVCCEEEREADKAVIVQFSNGNLKNTQKLDFTFYKNIDEANPRKKTRRMLVAESDRLSYVGNNFGTGSLKCNNLCKYYVGVLNKETMQMEVHSAQLFNMQPVIPVLGESTTETEPPEDSNKSYREKVDSLIEAFGTNKQKRALSSRRLNQVGSDTLLKAVAKAAENVIEQKGLEALQQEVAQTESMSDLAPFLPPCHPDADRPENVYLFNDLLTPVEYGALAEAGAKMAALTPEDLQKMRDDGRSLCVLNHLENLPSGGEARERQARCAYYLRLLIGMSWRKSISRKYGEEEGCPRIILNKLTKTFSVESFNNGSLQNVVSTSMRVKVAAYCLALLLHMGHMTANLTRLHRDLGLPENKIIEVAKSMGLTLIKPIRGKTKKEKEEAAAAPLMEEHKLATLELPLVKYNAMIERRKRKKMR
ncbi:DNA-directed RNA polymerase I subunit RPA49 [Aplochiton taeniatus]